MKCEKTEASYLNSYKQYLMALGKLLLIYFQKLGNEDSRACPRCTETDPGLKRVLVGKIYRINPNPDGEGKQRILL